MGALVEKRFGRAALVECMADPRRLLERYNQAAAQHNTAGGETLPLWSTELLEAVADPPRPRADEPSPGP